VPLHFDLAELRGYRYHTGTVFSAYMPGQGQAIAQGGRYDDIGKLFGYARPATGFSTDLRTLVRLVAAPPEPVRGILAPADDDTELTAEIDRLRAAGERVVRQLPGAKATACCTRRLIRQDGRWAIQDINSGEN
jgi:ATP phosphoribosyltransferase regulatory subunit